MLTGLTRIKKKTQWTTNSALFAFDRDQIEWGNRCIVQWFVRNLFADEMFCQEIFILFSRIREINSIEDFVFNCLVTWDVIGIKSQTVLCDTKTRRCFSRFDAKVKRRALLYWWCFEQNVKTQILLIQRQKIIELWSR